MPLRPRLRKSSSDSVESAPAPAPAAEPSPVEPSPAPSATIAERPKLERYGPVRTAGAPPSLTATLPIGSAAMPTAGRPPGSASPQTPAEQSVANAYEVIARYIEEGQRFAQGQSAWNNAQSGLPSGWSGTIGGATELLSVVGRLWTDLAKLMPAGWPNAAMVPGQTGPRYFHPQQRPDYPTAASSPSPPSGFPAPLPPVAPEGTARGRAEQGTARGRAEQGTARGRAEQLIGPSVQSGLTTAAPLGVAASSNPDGWVREELVGLTQENYISRPAPYSDEDPVRQAPPVLGGRH